MQYANLEQYFVALPINAGALNRGQAVCSGGIKDCERDHPFAELAFQIDKGFWKRGGGFSGMNGYGLQIWPPNQPFKHGYKHGKDK
jgi:hypothetical protein